MTSPDLPTARAERPSPPVSRAPLATRGMMGVGGALLFGGIWIEVFDGALRRIGPVGRQIIGYEWPILGAGVALVVLGAVLGRRVARRSASDSAS